MRKNYTKYGTLLVTLFIVLIGIAVAEESRVNKAPSFVKGFAAGLRPAPAECKLNILVSYGANDFSSQARELCDQANPRNKYCVNYCVNKANRDRLSARNVALAKVPKAPCLMPPKKNIYKTPEACLKDRLRHCSANCINKGKEQSRCSHNAMTDCKRVGVRKR